MPHAVIEYSNGLDVKVSQQLLVEAVHNCMADSGQFGEKDIKVRLYPCDHALVAGKQADFIHVTIYLLSGRSAEIKKALTSGVLKRIQKFGIEASSISVDARDLDRAVYSKAALE